MKLLFITLIIFLCGCVTPPKEEKGKEYNFKWFTGSNDILSNSGDLKVRVAVIDSCEYVYVMFDRSMSIAHKGNCKYCLARRK